MIETQAARDTATADRVAIALMKNGPSRIVRFGLAMLFFLAAHARWILRLIRPIAVRLTVWCSPSVRRNTRANARFIFGRELLPSELRAFTRGVIENFYDFVVDVGASAEQSADELFARIVSVDGKPRFDVARAAGRGAIMVTAHMGAFEVGLAALRQYEPSVHVVFKRDAFGGFESIRSRVRERLGVTEAPIDDGISSLMRLRDALHRNEVVVMQGDRAMPHQRSRLVPFLHGRLRLPVGPIKLAQVTGSPIIPVFVTRADGGGFQITLGDPIETSGDDEEESALLAVARSIEAIVAKHPTQWLVLDEAFVEDRS